MIKRIKAFLGLASKETNELSEFINDAVERLSFRVSVLEHERVELSMLGANLEGERITMSVLKGALERQLEELRKPKPKPRAKRKPKAKGAKK